jgi:hypothetical protein
VAAGRTSVLLGFVKQEPPNLKPYSSNFSFLCILGINFMKLMRGLHLSACPCYSISALQWKAKSAGPNKVDDCFHFQAN